MAWVNLSGAFGYGTILTSTQMQNLRDNITALANGDSGAPLISEVACDETESPGICKIKMGTYTGDGVDSAGGGQAITGVGFRPKWVQIWERPASEVATLIYEKLDASWGDYCIVHHSNHNSFDSKINTIDADGFTVEDDGINSPPNALDATYDYIAFR